MSRPREISPSDFMPNTTQIPNVVLDWLMAELSGTAFKVLMFFMRQTYGFQRPYGDFAYSLNEIQSGVHISVKQDDGTFTTRQVCAGTGCKRDAVLSAIKELESAHILQIASRGNRKAVNTYRFCPLDHLVGKTDKPLSENPTNPSRENRLALVGKSDPLRNQEETNKNLTTGTDTKEPAGEITSYQRSSDLNTPTPPLPRTPPPKKERKEPEFITILSEAYFLQNQGRPAFSKGNRISLAGIFKDFGQEKFTACANEWAKSKKQDGTPHPIGFFTHDPDQYWQRHLVSNKPAPPKTERDLLKEQKKRDWVAMEPKDYYLKYPNG